MLRPYPKESARKGKAGRPKGISRILINTAEKDETEARKNGNRSIIKIQTVTKQLDVLPNLISSLVPVTGTHLRT